MKYGINTLDDFDFDSKVVLCRLDLNSPYDRENKTLKEIFRELSDSDRDFRTNLSQLMRYIVIDMREPSNEQREKRCTGDYGSFLDTIYQIRCNLFHGRKNFEEDQKDRELVTLALKLLRPLFKKLLENHS